MPDDSFLINGNLGLGTDNPVANLHIEKSFSSTTLDSFTQLVGVRNTASDLLNQLSGLTFEQNNTTNTARGFIGIRSTGSSGTRADLIIASPNTSGSSTERIRIQSDGTINIGSSITINSSTGNLTAISFTGTVSQATNASNIAITDDNSTNSVRYITWTSSSSGNAALSISSSKLSFNPSTGTLMATAFSGGLTGNVTGNLSGTATNSTNIAITNDTTTNATMYPVWVTTTTGNLPAKVSSSKLTFNPSTGTLTATTFSGALSGNATTATTLQTAITINGTSFDGSASIVVDPQVDVSSTNATFYIPFVSGNTAGYKRLNLDSGSLTFNPSTNALDIGPLTASTVESQVYSKTPQAIITSQAYPLVGTPPTDFSIFDESSDIVFYDSIYDTGNTTTRDYDFSDMITSLLNPVPSTEGFLDMAHLFRLEIVGGYYNDTSTVSAYYSNVWWLLPFETTNSSGVTSYSYQGSSIAINGVNTSLDITPSLAMAGSSSIVPRATTSIFGIRWVLGTIQAAGRTCFWQMRMCLIRGT